MSRIQTLFADYDLYHKSFGNKVCHFVGIPLIVMSLLGLLAGIPVASLGSVQVNGACVLILLSGLYYLVLQWRLAVLMILVTMGLYLLGTSFSLWPLVGIQVVGWILQFVGHGVFEGQKPAFFKNLTHLLVGPLWILNAVAGIVPKGEEKAA